MSEPSHWERIRPWIEDDPDGERISIGVLANIIRIEGVPVEFGPYVAEAHKP